MNKPLPPVRPRPIAPVQPEFIRIASSELDSWLRGRIKGAEFALSEAASCADICDFAGAERMARDAADAFRDFRRIDAACALIDGIVNRTARRTARRKA